MMRRILLWLRSLGLLAVGLFYASGFLWIGKQSWILYAIYAVAAAIFTSASVLFGILDKEALIPWVFKQPPTSKSSLPSQSLSSFLAFQGNGPLPSQFSYPSASRSLPSVTIDQPVVGFRQWKLDRGGQLFPMAYDAAPWQATTIAKCGADKSHPSPDAACTCGLYAYFAAPKDAAWPSSGALCGAVLASGKILRHPTEGIRAEKMRVLAFSRPALKEVGLEPCPAFTAFNPMVAMGYSFSGTANPQPTAPIINENGAYRYAHLWATEDRELHLPTGIHRFKAKIKCEHCGCGPDREFRVLDHTADLAVLEQIAKHYGAPVVPVEKLGSYAAEFGIIATEVKALAA